MYKLGPNYNAPLWRGIPLDLAWGLTIHKSQGPIMAKAVIDIGHHKMTAGISFVALSLSLSRVWNINDLLVNNFARERITRLAINDQILQRKRDETRLRDI